MLPKFGIFQAPRPLPHKHTSGACGKHCWVCYLGGATGNLDVDGEWSSKWPIWRSRSGGRTIRVTSVTNQPRSSCRNRNGPVSRPGKLLQRNSSTKVDNRARDKEIGNDREVTDQGMVLSKQMRPKCKAINQSIVNTRSRLNTGGESRT